jgi:predicted dehydrogenase
LRFHDGSVGQINYFANGNKSFPKERLEVFSDGTVLHIGNFRRLRCYGRGGNKRHWTQDKGHDHEFRAFVEAIRSGGESPISFRSLVNTAEATFAVMAAVQREQVVTIDASGWATDRPAAEDSREAQPRDAPSSNTGDDGVVA